jgi:hypothetical protein
MSTNSDLAEFLKERNDMLLSLDIEWAKAFHRKHNPTLLIPADDVVEIGLHKARVAAASLPQAERDISRRWLTERGYASEGYLIGVPSGHDTRHHTRQNAHERPGRET